MYNIYTVSYPCTQLLRVADLLGTSADTLSHALTHKTVAVTDTAVAEVTETKRSISQACYTRDTLAKVYFCKYSVIIYYMYHDLTINYEVGE